MSNFEQGEKVDVEIDPPHLSASWPIDTPVQIDHDGFKGFVIGYYTRDDGKRGVVLQQFGTKVVHVYGEKWLKPLDIEQDPPPFYQSYGAYTLILLASKISKDIKSLFKT